MDNTNLNLKVRFAQDIADLTERFILMNGDEALIGTVLFNPFFLYRMKRELPELFKAGFVIGITETQTDKGNIISGFIRKKDKGIDLGSVLITTKGQIQVIGGLKTYTDLVRFIKENLN